MKRLLGVIVLVLSLVVLWAQPAHAATPVFGALGTGNFVSTPSTTDGMAVTQDIVVNSGEVLFLAVLCSGNIVPGSVTHNGDAPDATIVSNTAGSAKSHIYGWKNPDTGTHTTSWTPDEDGVACASAAATYSGADTAGLTWHNATTTTDTTATPTINITSASGEMALCFFSSRSFTPFSTTAGTQRWIRDGTGNGQGQAQVADASTATCTWSVGDAGDETDVLGFSLMGASGGVTTAGPRLLLMGAQ